MQDLEGHGPAQQLVAGDEHLCHAAGGQGTGHLIAASEDPPRLADQPPTRCFWGPVGEGPVVVGPDMPKRLSRPPSKPPPPFCLPGWTCGVGGGDGCGTAVTVRVTVAPLTTAVEAAGS